MLKATTPKPQPVEPTPAPPIIPIDPGDAHGLGAATEREIDPRYLHETAEEARARGSAWKPG